MSRYEALVDQAMHELHTLAHDYCRRFPMSDGMVMNTRVVKRLGERYSAGILWDAAQRLETAGAAEIRRTRYDESNPL